MDMRRALSCILLPVYVASCMSWRVEPVSPAQVVVQDQPSAIRVTMNDGSRFELESPVVSGDSLLGLAKSKSFAQRGVLLADISKVEIRKGDALKTVGLVVGLGMLFVGIATLGYYASCDDAFC
jgi:hypothetical protein